MLKIFNVVYKFFDFFYNLYLYRSLKDPESAGDRYDTRKVFISLKNK